MNHGGNQVLADPSTMEFVAEHYVMKVDVHLPRRVILVADCIIQRDSSQIISYNDNRDRDIIVQG